MCKIEYVPKLPVTKTKASTGNYFRILHAHTHTHTQMYSMTQFMSNPYYSSQDSNLQPLPII